MSAPITERTSCFSKKKKSLFLLFKVISSPALILCALRTIWLLSAWRYILERRTTLNALESMISFNTFPGPTLGSWLESPTRMSLVPGTIAFKSEYIRWISTIDISSRMTASASIGLSSFFSKWELSPSSIPPDTSKRRWIVFAS